MPTREEVDKLKASWVSDPCWDIEDTPGFEAYHEELLAYHKEMDEKWLDAYNAKRDKIAMALGCPENRKLAAWVMKVEERLGKLEGRPIA